MIRTSFQIILALSFNQLIAQSADDMSWWNPVETTFPVVEGQAWPDSVQYFYDRLPFKAKEQVRSEVWGLSKHGAGLMIRFRSNAEEIVVRYSVEGNHAMNHMPATGVSGVDLYAIDSDGQWLWCRGNRSFSDTIVYRFTSLSPNDSYHQQGREYRLYLPLYNRVDWLEIGVGSKNLFKPLPVRSEKPIVVYGTSIAQGACASRPGMAWTSILGRKMDRPLINLGFSGNGRLEKEVIDLINEVSAKIFILDCLPNLHRADTYSDEDVKSRILESVRQIRKQHTQTPILLVEHAGYTDGFIQKSRLTAYARVNHLQREAFDQLILEGHSNLFYLTKEELGLGLDDMVDGTHPNDLGMQHYAEGYEKALRKILNEPIGTASTTRPCIQYREPENYDWENRHIQILRMNVATPPKKIILANSIVHFWGGTPKAKIVKEEASWETLFTPMGVRNYAYGWDRIENVLWRVYHDELDGFDADKIVIMIGTNNLHLNSDQEIIQGLELLVQAIKDRQPRADLVLMGLLPRRDYEARIDKLNGEIQQLAENVGIHFSDIGAIFLTEQHSLNESLFSDGLHPNKAGYLKMRKAMQKVLNN